MNWKNWKIVSLVVAGAGAVALAAKGVMGKFRHGK